MFDIALPARADAQAAVQLREDILAAPADAPVRVDAREVTDLSTPMAAVLLSAAKRSGGFVLRRPSDAAVDAFSVLGLFAPFMTMEMEG